mmetsp:Transcript_101308/g.285673  ORF Transcript_101308/g.285673 Transcript_101308/m.285673 type:complete len:565 (-) Transcript_101308:12-1706(-)
MALGLAAVLVVSSAFTRTRAHDAEVPNSPVSRKGGSYRLAAGLEHHASEGSHSSRAILRKEQSSQSHFEDVHDRPPPASSDDVTPMAVPQDHTIAHASKDAGHSNQQLPAATGTIATKSNATASVLLGLIFVVLVTINLVNHSDAEIASFSSKTLSNVIAVFCSMLIFTIIKNLSGMLLESAGLASGADGHGSSHVSADGQGSAGGHDSASFAELTASGPSASGPNKFEIVMSMAVFLCCFLLMEVFLFRVRNSPIGLASWGLVGAHIVGFLAADVFATVQELKPWSESLLANAGWCCIGFVVVVSLVALADYVRNRIVQSDGAIDEQESAWLHQCVHSEDELVAFVMGLVMTQWYRFAITGQVLHFHGLQQNNNFGQIVAMCGIALGHMLLVFLLNASMSMIEEPGPIAKRLNSMVTYIIAMTASWSLLYYGKWQNWYALAAGWILNGDVITAQLYMAVTWCAIGFPCIYGLGRFQAKYTKFAPSCEALFECFGFLVGLSWESVFDFALKEQTWSSSTWAAHSQTIHECSVFSLLAAIVMHTWVEHILRKTLAAGEGHGHLTH